MKKQKVGFQKVCVLFLSLASGSAAWCSAAAAGADAAMELAQARRQIAALQVLDRFEVNAGLKLEVQSQQSARWERFLRELTILPEAEAYLDDDSCLVAGWEGVMREGRCRVGQEVLELSVSRSRKLSGEEAILQGLGERCGADEIACNPEVFGFRERGVLASQALHCIKRTESRMTLGCLRLSLGDAAGSEIPEPARKNTDEFSKYITQNSGFVSDRALRIWADRVQRAAGISGVANASLRQAREICSNIAAGTSRDRGLIEQIQEDLSEIGSPEARNASSRKIRQARGRIEKREADIRDCRILSTVSAAATRRSENPQVAERLQDWRESVQARLQEHESGYVRRPAVVSSAESQ